MLFRSEVVALQLGLEELEKRPVTIANGSSHLVPYVGPIRVDFEKRFCFVGALVLGNEILLYFTRCKLVNWFYQRIGS